MANEISNGDNTIDSRDIISRIEELESEREALADDVDEAQGTLNELKESGSDDTGEAEANWYSATEALKDWASSEEAIELQALKALAEQAEGYGDWEHGETLICESYFEEYAQELAEDIGAIDRDAKWPLMHIDWEAAARELKQDYTEVDFDGVTYLMRA